MKDKPLKKENEPKNYGMYGVPGEDPEDTDFRYFYKTLKRIAAEKKAKAEAAKKKK